MLINCNQDSSMRVLLDTEVKIAIESEDVDLTVCKFDVEIYIRRNRKVCLPKKKLMRVIGTKQYMAVVDTSLLGPGGPVNLVVRAQVPDENCVDGYRTEVAHCIVQGISNIVSV